MGPALRFALIANETELAVLLETLELAAHRNYYQGQLLLGLARRVALARAFAVNPSLLLLDEPFVSLDDELASRLREELGELVNRRSLMTLLVPHNRKKRSGLLTGFFFFPLARLEYLPNFRSPVLAE
jgi:ABC-type sulfate/molybdate transport systems ATPase subunit